MESAAAEAVALAVAVALGLTLAAAEMVAAVVEPAVAVTLAVADADVAEAPPLDVCARAAEANRATAAANASNMTAADSSGIFLLNNNAPSSSCSGITYRLLLYRNVELGVSPKRVIFF